MSTSNQSGYGKQLNQLTAEEMTWWHANSFKPVAGGTYLCRRGNTRHGTQAGKVYVFDGENLLHFSARNQTMLLNGYNTLRQAYAFEVHPKCPICGTAVFGLGEGSPVIHQVLQCAKEDALTRA